MNSIISKINRIEDSNKEVSDFYESILKNINNLINEKKYNESIKILEEELMQPYLPNKYYDLFNEKKFEILSLISDIKYEKKFWTKSPEEILSFINNSNVDIYEYWNVFITKIEENNISIINFHNQIDLIFQSNKINNFDKMMILKHLAIEEYDKEINFYNNHTNKSLKITSKSLDELFINLGYNNIWKKINEKMFKDIVKNNFCTEVLNAVFEYYFPYFEFDSLDSAIESIIQYVDFSMNNNFINKNIHPEFYKIEKIFLK